MKSYHHNSNDFLFGSEINTTFDKIFKMSDATFEKWVQKVQETIRTSWVEHEQPPYKTKDDDGLIRDFRRLIQLDVNDVRGFDGISHKQDVLNPKTSFATASSFFPNMLKVKDIQSTDLTGLSLWDHFVDDQHFDRLHEGLRRNIRQDSFYYFAPILYPHLDVANSQKTGLSWIKEFQSKPIDNTDFFIDEGGWKRVNGNNPLTVTKAQLETLLADKTISRRHARSVGIKDAKSTDRFRIRVYDTEQKILPHLFDCFRKGIVAQAVNFPPVIAKYIYKTYTDHLKDQDRIVIYDPSSGFGGRMLGALSLNQDRKIHYVGTDPNPDNTIPELGMTRYEYMAWFFNNNFRSKNPTTYELFTHGSEVVHQDRKFQKYKGKIDLVFTSPPYFAAEGYSEDENQSFKKFPEYETWRDGFLRPTLTTCVNYLKPGGWLLWNIADVSFGGKYHPLEKDSVDILLELGMTYQERLKMLLAGGQTGNKMNKIRRVPSTKNFCLYNMKYRKYEPIFCFQKPI